MGVVGGPAVGRCGVFAAEARACEGAGVDGDGVNRAGNCGECAIFSLVSKFVLEPPPVGDPSTLVALSRTYEHGQCCNYFPAPVYRDVQEQAQSFSGVAAYYDAVPASIGAGGESKREWGQAATEGYFDVAQLKTAAGHGFAANEEHAPVIVLGYRL